MNLIFLDAAGAVGFVIGGLVFAIIALVLVIFAIIKIVKIIKARKKEGEIRE